MMSVIYAGLFWWICVAEAGIFMVMYRVGFPVPGSLTRNLVLLLLCLLALVLLIVVRRRRRDAIQEEKEEARLANEESTLELILPNRPIDDSSLGGI
jgi:hypothetical protein